MGEEEGEGIDIDSFETQLNEKIDNYFSSNNNNLLSYENLDDFLKGVELYDLWNSEEEKDTLWQSLMKYGTDDKVDLEGTKKGMHDLLNKEEDDDNNGENKDKENKDENLLTRISRISLKNDGSGTVNKLVLNKYKQRALDEFDCLDNPTLIQFKKIFLLLNINENNKNIIPVEKIDEITKKHKFIKLDKNEIIKYLHFLSCDDKPIDEITSININNTIYAEIDFFLQEKLNDEDLDQYEENEEEENNKEDDPLDILDEILQNIEATKENSLILKDMKKNIVKTNKNFTETVTKMMQDAGGEFAGDNIAHVEGLGVETIEKMEKFDEYLSNLTKEQKSSIKKIHSLKKSIINFNNEMSTLKEDYRSIYEKYNNNQELEVDDEMERLLDENVALNQELNSKKDELSELINERAQKDNQINDLYIKLEESQKNEKELNKQVNELKIAAAKTKEEYDNLMDNVFSKMQKKENEEMMERNKIKEMIENQLKNEEEKKDNEDKVEDKLNIKALNDIDNMNISLTDKLLKKKKILSQLSPEQLMEYTLKIERINISLKSEKIKKDKKIKELEEKINQANQNLSSNKKQIGTLNIEIKKLQTIISNLKNEVKTNEVFRPSIAMNSQMRISRMSKLNTQGINAMKFKEFKVENKIKNSNDYFKNMAFNIGGKKQIKTAKLKDENINKKLGKEQNINLAPQNLINTMYGNDDKIVEEQDEEDPEQPPKDKNSNNAKDNNAVENKNNFEISKNNEAQIDGQKSPFNNLTQNGIEFNIQSGVDNMITEEGGEIMVDNINDINLGGSTKELFEVKEDKDNKENDGQGDKTKGTQHVTVSSFFESKPLENNLEINDEKKDDDEDNNSFGSQRDTIQIKNNNQMVFGGLEDMILAEMENNEEEDEKDDKEDKEDKEEKEEKEDNPPEQEINENNSSNKYELQIGKSGLGIDGKENKENKNDNIDKENKNNNNDNMIQNNKDLNLVSDNNIEIKGNNQKNKINNLEINSGNNINIEKGEKQNNLEINNNNQFNIEDKNIAKSNSFEMVNDFINIEKDPKDKKNSFSISSNNSSIINNSKNSNLSKSLQLKPVSNNTIETHGMQITKAQKAEIENNNYDYYSLFHEDYVLNKLKELGDNANEKNIYSDQIYLLIGGRKLEKRLILLTPSHLYIIEPKEPQFVLIMDKAEINKIAISNQNLNILIFIRNKCENVILLTLRRMDLLYFLKEHYHHSKKPIRFIYEDSFKILVKGKESILSVKDKIFTTLSNFDGAIKIGYLQKMSPLFFKTFSERLVVLTSIGLIVFNDPTKPPERLYPIIGSKISKALGTKYKRPNCFEILTPSGETKVFSAYKERELNSWIEEFNKVKKDFTNKMKKLDTVNKLEFINNKNSLYHVKEEENDDELIPEDK